MPNSSPLLLQAPDGRWLAYEDPSEILEAWHAEEVAPLIEALEAAAAAGLTAVGFLSYEAARAFDPALVTHPAGPLPLAWFGLFEQARPIDLAEIEESDWEAGNLEAGEWEAGEWKPSLEPGPYGEAIADIHESIARGDTYQVNFTQRLGASFSGSPLAFFRDLAISADSRHGAYIDTGHHAVCSFSPELFFSLRGDRLTTRPMKGTAPRGRTNAEDAALRERLRESIKDRAENVMIVDMMRNDLGRIARSGTVAVENLWEIERYRTLFQMTSTCTAETDAGVGEILKALFPSASITGAPKVRTMEIIRALETSPRGIYTGAIGRIGPGRRADFNVAIRTVHIDRRRELAEYGIGGGIVWDSIAEDEYRECLTKALVVTAPAPTFSLLETLRWEPGTGFALLDRHLDRLEESATYFDRPCDRTAVATELEAAIATATSPQRVRLTLDPQGLPKVETRAFERHESTWRVEMAATPIDPRDPLLFHKTTSRDLYDRARRQCPEADDVLLWNPSGEITESTLANVVIRQGDGWLTPPIDCGLLAGTLRGELLAQGRIHEALVRREDLESADELFLINSVRGWIPARLHAATETLVAEPA
jgi:para-aminobenzoate synthetase/4-amino-4-deoxychorismate lyase